MSPDVTSRYTTTYRADEIESIISFALRGESLGFVGLAGVGKSNIVNFLRDIRQQAPQVEQNVERVHFCIVDATQWSGTADNLWKMMLSALKQAAAGLPVAEDNRKVISISEEDRTFDTLRTQLRWICQELEQQVMFVLDDFDRVLSQGPLPMLERLSGLRAEGNRGHLSYLVLTKRLPHVLGRRYDLENQSKFYDLFRQHIYALEPYNQADAGRMLQHLNERADLPLAEDQLRQIYHLAGGHAQLLKNVFNSWIETAPSGLKAAHFAHKAEIRRECRRILINLHEEEQAVAQLVARGQHTAEHAAMIDHLARRGLLTNQEPISWFSPLMPHFLTTYSE